MSYIQRMRTIFLHKSWLLTSRSQVFLSEFLWRSYLGALKIQQIRTSFECFCVIRSSFRVLSFPNYRSVLAIRCRPRGLQIGSIQCRSLRSSYASESAPKTTRGLARWRGTGLEQYRRSQLLLTPVQFFPSSSRLESSTRSWRSI